jgi:hypothetical protein
VSEYNRPQARPKFSQQCRGRHGAVIPDGPGAHTTQPRGAAQRLLPIAHLFSMAAASRNAIRMAERGGRPEVRIIKCPQASDGMASAFDALIKEIAASATTNSPLEDRVAVPTPGPSARCGRKGATLDGFRSHTLGFPVRQPLGRPQTHSDDALIAASCPAQVGM